MAKTRNIRADSAKAVADAGTRQKGGPSKCAGTWREERGRIVDGPFRPGKTAAKRKR